MEIFKQRKRIPKWDEKEHSIYADDPNLCNKDKTETFYLKKVALHHPKSYL